MNCNLKNVSFELKEATHLKLKIKCATIGVHIKVYMAELVEKDLEESEEPKK